MLVLFWFWMNLSHTSCYRSSLCSFFTSCIYYLSFVLNGFVSMARLYRLLHRAPQLTHLGTGSFSATEPGAEIWADYLPAIYPVCANLTSLNLSYADVIADQLKSVIRHCPKLQIFWVLDSIRDEGLRAVAATCKHRKDHTDLHRVTEKERDIIEHEVSTFIKTCQEQIDILKNSINQEEETSKGHAITELLFPLPNTGYETMIVIPCERLHSVTAQFDQLRAVRCQDAINKVILRRKLNRVTRKDSAETSKSGDMELRELEELQAELLRVQQLLLDDETRALQVELTSLLDTVQETETKMVEMSALNHLMSTHVLQQAQQIEHLYEQAVEATKNVELGN
ncbi:hypothetical protein VNO78_13224 [Psophocarpus tetragonolobus]|uniref:Uncharacterized protein n=1 Tax=Psophocarpus tetragonolobus TaxID=3891 RepID=A0AAN9SRQ7_PSOTE